MELIKGGKKPEQEKPKTIQVNQKKCRVLRITFRAIIALLDKGKHLYEVTEDPLPQDAQLIAWRTCANGILEMVLYSEQFPEVSSPVGTMVQLVPRLIIQEASPILSASGRTIPSAKPSIIN